VKRDRLPIHTQKLWSRVHIRGLKQLTKASLWTAQRATASALPALPPALNICNGDMCPETATPPQDATAAAASETSGPRTGCCSTSLQHMPPGQQHDTYLCRSQIIPLLEWIESVSDCMLGNASGNRVDGCCPKATDVNTSPAPRIPDAKGGYQRIKSNSLTSEALCTALHALTEARTPAAFHACTRQAFGKLIETTRAYVVSDTREAPANMLELLLDVLLLTEVVLFGSNLISSSLQCTWVTWLDRWLTVWLERWAAVPRNTDASAAVHQVYQQARLRDVLYACETVASGACQTGTNLAFAFERLSLHRAAGVTSHVSGTVHQAGLVTHALLHPDSKTSPSGTTLPGSAAMLGIESCRSLLTTQEPLTSSSSGLRHCSTGRASDSCSNAHEAPATRADAHMLLHDEFRQAEVGMVRESAGNHAVIPAPNALTSTLSTQQSTTDDARSGFVSTCAVGALPPSSPTSSSSSSTPTPQQEAISAACAAAPAESACALDHSTRASAWMWLLVVLGHLRGPQSTPFPIEDDRNEAGVLLWMACLEPVQLRGLYALSKSSIFRDALHQHKNWNEYVPLLVHASLREYEALLAARCRLEPFTVETAMAEASTQWRLPPELCDDVARCACRLASEVTGPSSVPVLLSLLCNETVPRSVSWNAAKSLALLDIRDGIAPWHRLECQRLTAFSQLAYLRSRLEHDTEATRELQTGTEEASAVFADSSEDPSVPGRALATVARAADPADAGASSEAFSRNEPQHSCSWLASAAQTLERLHHEHPTDRTLRTVAAETLALLVERIPGQRYAEALLLRLLMESTDLPDRFFQQSIQKMHRETLVSACTLPMLQQIWSKCCSLMPCHFRFLRIMVQENGVDAMHETADELLQRALLALNDHSMMLVKSALGFLEAWYLAEKRLRARGASIPTSRLLVRIGCFLQEFLARSPAERYVSASRLGVTLLPMLLRHGATVRELWECLCGARDPREGSLETTTGAPQVSGKHCDSSADRTHEHQHQHEQVRERFHRVLEGSTLPYLLLLVTVALVRARVVTRVELVVVDDVESNNGATEYQVCGEHRQHYLTAPKHAAQCLFVPQWLAQWALAHAEDTIALDALYLLTQPNVLTTAPIPLGHLQLLLEALPALTVGTLAPKSTQMLRQFFIKYMGPACQALVQGSGFWASVDFLPGTDSAAQVPDAESWSAKRSGTLSRTRPEEALTKADAEAAAAEATFLSQTRDVNVSAKATAAAGPGTAPGMQNASAVDIESNEVISSNRDLYAIQLVRFLKSWVRLLTLQIGPGVGLTRRLAAISLLESLPVQVWRFVEHQCPQHIRIMEDCIAVALGCLLDPYDSIRVRAWALLRNLAAYADLNTVMRVLVPTGSVLVRSWTRRKADSGALLLRTAVMFMDKAASPRSLGKLEVSRISLGNGVGTPAQEAPSRVTLLEALATILANVDIKRHGVVLTLRYLLDDCMDSATGRWIQPPKPSLALLTRLSQACITLEERCSALFATQHDGYEAALQTDPLSEDEAFASTASAEDTQDRAHWENQTSNTSLAASAEFAYDADAEERVSDDSQATCAEFARRSTQHGVFLIIREICYITSIIIRLLLDEFHPEESLDEAFVVPSTADWVVGAAVSVSPATVAALVEFLTDFLAGMLLRYRHSGICGHASICWRSVCKQLVKHTDPALRALPNRCLDLIVQRLHHGGFAVLRRSAGLAYLVQGVVAASANSPLDALVDVLLRMARSWCDGQALGSVHAMHILRALLQDASLTQRTAHLVPLAFQVALDGFQGTAPWMIRNAALLLLAACIQRILGGQIVQGTTAFRVANKTNRSHEQGSSERTLHDLPGLQTRSGARTRITDTSTQAFRLEAYWEEPLVLVQSRALTMDVFLSRYAGILESLCRLLQQAAASTTSASVHPGALTAVYPVLVLLSRLAPLSTSTDELGDGAASSAVAFPDRPEALCFSGRRSVLRILLEAVERLTVSAEGAVRRKAALCWARIWQTCCSADAAPCLWPDDSTDAAAVQGIILRLRYLQAVGACPSSVREAFQKRFNPESFARRFGLDATIEALRLYGEFGLQTEPSQWLSFCSWAVRLASTDASVPAMIMAALALRRFCGACSAACAILDDNEYAEEALRSAGPTFAARFEMNAAHEERVPASCTDALVLSYLYSVAATCPLPELVATALQLAQERSLGGIPSAWIPLLLRQLRYSSNLCVLAAALRWIIQTSPDHPAFFPAVWRHYLAAAHTSTTLGDLALEALGSLVHDAPRARQWVQALEALGHSAYAGTPQAPRVSVERRLAMTRSLQRAFCCNYWRMPERTLAAFFWSERLRIHGVCWRLLGDDEEIVRCEARRAVALFWGQPLYATLRRGYLEQQLARDLVYAVLQEQAEMIPAPYNTDDAALSTYLIGTCVGAVHQHKSFSSQVSVQAALEGQSTMERQRCQSRSGPGYWHLLYSSDDLHVSDVEPLSAEQLALYVQVMLKQARNGRLCVGGSGEAMSIQGAFSAHANLFRIPDAVSARFSDKRAPPQTPSSVPWAASQAPLHGQGFVDFGQHVRGYALETVRASFRELFVETLKAAASEASAPPAELRESVPRCPTDERAFSYASLTGADSRLEQLVKGQFQAMQVPGVFSKRYRLWMQRVMGLEHTESASLDEFSELDLAPALWRWSRCTTQQMLCPQRANALRDVEEERHSAARASCETVISNTDDQPVWYLLPVSRIGVKENL